MGKSSFEINIKLLQVIYLIYLGMPITLWTSSLIPAMIAKYVCTQNPSNLIYLYNCYIRCEHRLMDDTKYSSQKWSGYCDHWLNRLWSYKKVMQLIFNCCTSSLEYKSMSQLVKTLFPRNSETNGPGWILERFLTRVCYLIVYLCSIIGLVFRSESSQEEDREVS